MKAKPIVHWAGGKGKLVPVIQKLASRIDYTAYIEPFVGGGAVWLGMDHPEDMPDVFINDLNTDLYNMYREVWHNPDEVIQNLKLLTDRFVNPDGWMTTDDCYYYYIRSWDREPDFNPLGPLAAARFLFLNKTAYNGLYRVNKKGQFNAPLGTQRNADSIINEHGVWALHEHMVSRGKGLTLGNMDYLMFSDYAEGTSLTYFDPPYIPVKADSFVGYTKDGFSLNDHTNLVKECARIDALGGHFIVSNSDTPTTRQLWREYGPETAEIHEVQMSRAINSDAKGRGKVGELLITNIEGEL